jgi:hypothetical protein
MKKKYSKLDIETKEISLKENYAGLSSSLPEDNGVPFGWGE